MSGLQRLASQLRAAAGSRLREGEPLSQHTSFAIGGPADLFIEAETPQEMVTWVRLAWAEAVPVTVLGGGTNVVVSDAGVRGLVIVNLCDRFSISPEGRLKVESGRHLADIANWTVNEGWAGLQWAVGIPGTVGGAVVGNAGAYGGYMSDVVRTVTLLHPKGDVRTVSASALHFGYRTSALKAEGGAARRAVVLEVEIELQRGDAPALRAEALRNNELRWSRTPQGCCAGSMFKRTMQYPAGFLIEQAGLKGYRVGGARVSPKHASFIMNEGGATAAEVRALMEYVQRQVWLTFAQHLEPEVEFIGAWEPEPALPRRREAKVGHGQA